MGKVENLVVHWGQQKAPWRAPPFHRMKGIGRHKVVRMTRHDELVLAIRMPLV